MPSNSYGSVTAVDGSDGRSCMTRCAQSPVAACSGDTDADDLAAFGIGFSLFDMPALSRAGGPDRVPRSRPSGGRSAVTISGSDAPGPPKRTRREQPRPIRRGRPHPTRSADRDVPSRLAMAAAAA